MAWITAGSYKRLPPGSVMEVIADGRRFAVANVDGQVCALDGVCPHSGGPLGHGGLHGAILCCPWHAWEFDCRTGIDPLHPEVRVATYPVRIEGDEILIEIK